MKMIRRIMLMACVTGTFLMPGGAEELTRAGVVQFSDGETREGRISMTRGKDLVLQNDSLTRHISLSCVREIRLRPEREEMLRKFRFPEAGQTRKEEYGRPYPVRYLAADLLLADNEPLNGHLYTTVIYVETTNGTEKIILSAKQRGEEGTSLDALIYPARITFKDEAANVTSQASVTLAFPPEQGNTNRLELCALTRDSLVRLEARKATGSAQYLMPAPLGAQFFAAVRQGGVIYVGWPAGEDENLFGKVKETLAAVRDFFDEKKLLGVIRDAPAGNVYSLMMLSRKAPTTLAARQNLPWRCELWRWRYDEAGQRLMLAGRGYFFRGIVGKDEALPEVRVSEPMGHTRIDGDCIVIGREQP